MAEWYPKDANGVYRQSREHRQMELVEAARWVARENLLNPYLKEDERKAIADYGYHGIRSDISAAFILAHKDRIYHYAFSTMRKSAQEWIDWFENVASHVPDKIKAHAIAQGHFVGVDCHAPLFADAWRAYGERCKREATP